MLCRFSPPQKRALSVALLLVITCGYFYLFFSQRIPPAFIHMSYIVFALIFTVIVCYHNNTRLLTREDALHQHHQDHQVTYNPTTLPQYPPPHYPLPVTRSSINFLPRYSPTIEPLNVSNASSTSLVPPPPVYEPSRGAKPGHPNVFSAP